MNLLIKCNMGFIFYLKVIEFLDWKFIILCFSVVFLCEMVCIIIID